MHSQFPHLAIVTGTSSGIGSSLARRLLDTGWTVIGLSRREVEFSHPGYRHISIDLGDSDRLIAVAIQTLRPIISEDGWERVALVNNAALVGARKGLEYIEPRELQQLFAVNTGAPMFLMGFITRVTPADLPLRIVNVSSGAAVHAFPGLADYCASKAALRMAGMAIAAEFDSDMRPGGRRQNAAVYELGGWRDLPANTISG